MKTKKILLIVISVCISSARAQIKDSLTFYQTLEHDTFKVFVQKKFTDTAYISPKAVGYNDNVFSVFSSKPNNLGNIIFPQWVKDQLDSFALDTFDITVPTDSVVFKQLLEIRLVKHSIAIVDTAKQLLFAFKLKSKGDTMLAESRVLSYANFSSLGTPKQTDLKTEFLGQDFEKSVQIEILNLYADAWFNHYTALGIKNGNNADVQDMNYGICKAGIIAIVFDGKTLRRKVLNIDSVQPLCKWGRAVSEFGDPYDFQIYYDFDLTKAADRQRFAVFLRNIPSCDYLTVVSNSYLQMNDITSEMDSLMGTFGANKFKKSNKSVAYTLIGRKGEVRGTAQEALDTQKYIFVKRRCVSVDSNCNARILKLSYKPLYYSLPIILPNSVNAISQPKATIFPNPIVGKTFSIETTFELPNIEIRMFDINGRLVHCFKNFASSTFQLPITIIPGMYYFQIREFDEPILNNKVLVVD